MTFTVSTLDAGIVRLAIEGELDAVTATDLRKEVDRLSGLHPKRVEALGHGVVVVVQAPLRTAFGHAGVLVHGVIILDPLKGFLDAEVVLGDAAVDEAFDAGVGHAAVAGPAAVG